MPPTTIRASLLRPQCSLLSSTKPSHTSRTTSHSQQLRHESTYRRHAQRLHLPPAPTFTPQSSTPQSTHIIFNPPSSAPNVYHTPLKFLPPGDKRRALYESSQSLYSLSKDAASPMTRPGTHLHESERSLPAAMGPRLPESGPKPPSLKPVTGKKYHLTEADVKEMKKLRDEDPRHWTQARLATKFNCSQFFVRLVAKNEEAGAEHEKRLEEVKKKWGPGRRQARLERTRRKELWGQDA
jgi:Mitochondrial ribosomal protein subunit L20